MAKTSKVATKKEKIGAGILFAWYFLFMFVLPTLYGRFFPDAPEWIMVALEIFTYISLIAGAFIVFGKRFRRDFEEIKKNKQGYAKWFFIRAVIIFGIFLVSRIITILLSGTLTSTNQESLGESPMWLIAPLAILYAPLVEESVFRGAIRRYVKKDWLFIIVSGVLFGAIHVFSEATFTDALLNGIPYAVMGVGMAYLYAKSGNLFTNMAYHFLQNTLSIIIMIVLL